MMGCLVSKSEAKETTSRYKVTMARKLFCSKEQPRDRYTTISNTWSSDQLIDEPTTAEGSGNLGDTGELHDSEADYSMISVLSFLATGTEDEFVANSTSPKMEFTEEKSPISERPEKLSEPRRQWVSLGNLILNGEWPETVTEEGDKEVTVSED